MNVSDWIDAAIDNVSIALYEAKKVIDVREDDLQIILDKLKDMQEDQPE